MRWKLGGRNTRSRFWIRMEMEVIMVVRKFKRMGTTTKLLIIKEKKY